MPSSSELVLTWLTQHVNWTPAYIRTDEDAFELLHALPEVRDAAWTAAWSRADAAQKQLLAQVWLVRLYAEAYLSGDTNRGAPYLFSSADAPISDFRRYQPAWSSAYVQQLRHSYLGDPYTCDWLDPIGPSAERYRRLWFGTPDEQLTTLAELVFRPATHVFTSVGQETAYIILELSHPLLACPDFSEIHHITRAAYAFDLGGPSMYKLPKTHTEREARWYRVGQYLVPSDPCEQPTLLAADFVAILQESRESRLHMLRHIARVWKTTETFSTREGLLATWLSYKQGQDASMYDIAAALSPEHQLDWRNAESLGISVDDCVDQLLATDRTLSAPMLPLDYQLVS